MKQRQPKNSDFDEILGTYNYLSIVLEKKKDVNKTFL